MKLAGVLGPRSYKHLDIPDEMEVAENRGVARAEHLDPLEQRTKLWSRFKGPAREQIRHRLSAMKSVRAFESALGHMPKAAAEDHLQAGTPLAAGMGAGLGILAAHAAAGGVHAKFHHGGNKSLRNIARVFGRGAMKADPRSTILAGGLGAGLGAGIKMLRNRRQHESKVAFVRGFVGEMGTLGRPTLEKEANTLGTVLGAVGTGIGAGASALANIPFPGGMILGNIGQYAAVMSSPKLRAFISKHGKTFLRTGFKHAIEGKRVGKLAGPAIASGLAAGAAPMNTYFTGWNIGNAVKDKLEFLPGMKARDSLKFLQHLDTALQTTLSTAPISGAVLGAGGGYMGEKALHPKRKLTGKEISKSMLTGGAVGALAGLGVRQFGPGFPGPKHLHEIRTKFIDDIVKGTNSKIEKWFDRAAKPVATSQAAPVSIMEE